MLSPDVVRLPMPVPPELGDPRYGVYLDLRDLVMVAYRHTRANPTAVRVARFIEANYADYLSTCTALELSTPDQSACEASDAALRPDDRLEVKKPRPPPLTSKAEASHR